MGCGASRPAEWEKVTRAEFVPLTLHTRWVGERGSEAAQLELTVTDESNTTLLKLYGGFLVNKANHVLPTEAIIVAATGERYRGICTYKSHDTWHWSLQTSRAATGRAPAIWNARSACRPCTIRSSGQRTPTLAAAATSSAAAASCGACRRSRRAAARCAARRSPRE